MKMKMVVNFRGIVKGMVEIAVKIVIPVNLRRYIRTILIMSTRMIK